MSDNVNNTIICHTHEIAFCNLVPTILSNCFSVELRFILSLSSLVLSFLRFSFLLPCFLKFITSSNVSFFTGVFENISLLFFLFLSVCLFVLPSIYPHLTPRKSLKELKWYLVLKTLIKLLAHLNFFKLTKTNILSEVRHPFLCAS
jgi:hypothetical protein